MSDDDWNLWYEYQQQKEEMLAWYKYVCEHDFPEIVFLEPTDEELMNWMEGIRAA